LAFPPPDWLMPDKSPFTSAMNTGTPRLEKPSANVCKVTVLPVPVAPAIKPWRVAILGKIKLDISLFFAIRIGSDILFLDLNDDLYLRRH